ncbi:MAG: glutaredoxin family protein [Leptolyngbyaceae cyanobacterium]
MFFHPRWFVYGVMVVGLGLGSCQTNSSQPTTLADSEAVAIAPETASEIAVEVSTEASAEPSEGKGLANPSENEADSFEMGLAQHLTSNGARMYGAYWCPHCQDQKAMFGEAISEIDYVECDPDGEEARPQLCQEANIRGYPTWIIDGQTYPGVRSLEELAEISGYTGDES